jgi:Tol biopolymer transport system component
MMIIAVLPLGVFGSVWAHDATPAASTQPLIVYETIDSGGIISIWTMNSDGTEPVKHLGSQTLSGKHPVWSPDGSSIIFINNVDGSIWTMNADGSDQTELLACADLCDEMDYPSWSPDGSKVVFLAYSDESAGPPARSSLMTLDLQSGDLTTLADAALPRILDTPQWSPDGQTIVLAMNELDDEFNQTGAALATMPASGGELTWLTEFSLYAYYPTWNAVTNQIVFGQEPVLWSGASDADTQPLNLWVINPDGAGLEAITDLAEGEALVQSAWTPDGTRIIATLMDRNGPRLVWVDPASGEITKMPTTAGNLYPRLQPVGKSPD